MVDLGDSPGLGSLRQLLRHARTRALAQMIARGSRLRARDAGRYTLSSERRPFPVRASARWAVSWMDEHFPGDPSAPDCLRSRTRPGPHGQHRTSGRWESGHQVSELQMEAVEARYVGMCSRVRILLEHVRNAGRVPLMRKAVGQDAVHALRHVVRPRRLV